MMNYWTLDYWKVEHERGLAVGTKVVKVGVGNVVGGWFVYPCCFGLRNGRMIFLVEEGRRVGKS